MTNQREIRIKLSDIKKVDDFLISRTFPHVIGQRHLYNDFKRYNETKISIRTFNLIVLFLRPNVKKWKSVVKGKHVRTLKGL